MSAQSWEAATFAGAAAAQAERMAALSPDQRMDIVESLLQAALESGALQRAREQKQREIDRMWHGEPGPV